MVVQIFSVVIYVYTVNTKLYQSMKLVNSKLRFRFSCNLMITINGFKILNKLIALIPAVIFCKRSFNLRNLSNSINNFFN